MNKQVMLSTIDNPYNPFVDYDKWYEYDIMKGHNTCGLLARVAVVSDELSEEETDRAIDLAIDEIVFYNVSGVHVKVFNNQ